VLRWLLGLLAAANLVVWAWTQPSVAALLGLPAWDSQREPERLTRQVRPEAIRLVPEPQKAASASDLAATTAQAAASAAPPDTLASAATTALAASGSAPAAGRVCIQQGPLTDEQFRATTAVLGQLGLRSDAWFDMRRELPGRWAVYMGRFTDTEQMQKKRDELRRLGVAHEPLLKHPSLSPGITLGEFDAEAGAKVGLETLQKRGVRTARVVQVAAPATEHRVQLEGLQADTGSRVRNSAAAAQGAWGLCTPP
jgi:hypothetical protein